MDKDAAVQEVLQEFDTDKDSYLDKEEFVNGMKKWLIKAKEAQPGSATMKLLNVFREQTKSEHDLSGAEDHSDEDVERVKNPKWTAFKASMMLLLGTVIAAVVSNPLVDAVDNFSDATSIPTFFVSFIALPLATTSKEAVSLIITASRKKKRTAELTFSELYGVVTMKSILCLSVFLALVYIKGCPWDFTSEVLVILIVCIVMGGFASFRTTFPLWTCSVAFILYPFSLVLVYVLHDVFGWS